MDVTMFCACWHVQLVKVTRTHQASNPDGSVVENEVLLIKGAKNKLTGNNAMTCVLASNTCLAPVLCSVSVATPT